MSVKIYFYNEKWESLLPLPQDESCQFLFGAEVDMNHAEVLGIDNVLLNEIDFCVISVGHLWLKSFTIPADYPDLDAQTKKNIYKSRLLLLLNRDDLDFSKIGVGHFTCGFGKDSLSLFTDDEYKEIFTLIAKKGAGVELNFALPKNDDEYLYEILRPYKIAKEVGCKFYLGGDAHIPAELTKCKDKFETMIDVLDLTEDDKWDFVKRHIYNNVV